jgi:parallel beta-helix repeat protein
MFFAASQSAQAQPIHVTTCGQTLSVAGEYMLMNDLNCTAATGDFDGVRITASNVTFHLAGHTISNPDCDQSRNITGIFVVGGITNVKIDGGNVSGFNDGVVLSSSNSSVKGMKVTGACLSGIHVQGVNNRVEKNSATGNGDGVSLLSTKNATVRCNYLSGNTRNGVTVSGTGTTNNFLEANIIEDNIINNNGSVGGFGVAVINGSYNIVRDNAVNHNRNGIFIDTPNNRVRDNTVNGSTDVGISVGSFGTTNTVRRNTVLGSGNTDMTDDNAGCDANTWRNNTFMTDLVAGVSDGGPNTGCIQ